MKKLELNEYMNLALQLARANQGQTSPNPVVGAVVVKDGSIVGTGSHLKAGGPHAEVHAIREAGDKAEGADIYVTLEPCSHHGRTPPCANLIIESGIKRVFIACKDPNPLVGGRGIERLKEAGIDVHLGMGESEALELNKHFFHFIRTGTPFVTLKSAVTLDGKTASSSGESKWITSQQSRLDVHYDRHRHDAIVVGVNTIIQDNPHLTTRLPQGGKNPIRLIVDTHLRTPIHSHIIQDRQSPTILITGCEVPEFRKQAYIQEGCEILSLSSPAITMKELVGELGKKSITSVYVEGGSSIHGSFLQEEAFQELILYMAPKLLGGRNSFPSFGGDGFPSIAEGLPVEIQSIETIGKDIKITAVPQERKEGRACSQES
ncbi:bifunctional diaminohydroxyphosphoribosylaminopyrimidine deaminase/5-amino-6-(5-phosphoribosylamino)uracil reductase RibD [Rossellomorea marisflavi]|uniref:bifunctional diaminohydroxyphosphoribosylaminopyrimidine deaminase/5-amino-6-(5-phosphoribosylamino)uracil reductase RibD n=1 Tax=Rossellomorea marisflavi TaxID=189381 RepID=UPI0020799A67|nr:bifunctional diaminohydroxyphosphoribosylaminopyrimidine deaminase/5-amino-6-(5-phosphoribosylamino)uracil reductase RibD [Rossellomorea marisflavi]USK90471.1 bifunctional diaminohydroxyphosphoribosylaminopyrimidine deaminase/5-amino-6-(5-phosphoribosylamino)uracil reductase RibD [Rossellomorea marisflavi]